MAETKRPTKIDVLLADLDKRSMACGGADRALFILLNKNRDKLPALDDYFHKAFRQIDVTDSGTTDMVIWHLLGGSELFWKCFDRAKARGAVKRFIDES